MTFLRYIKIALLALIAVALVIVALANNALVTLRLLPPDLAAFIGMNFEIRLPLFLVIIGGVVVGLLIGFIWEWLREHRYRAAARRAERELARQQATKPGAAPKDELEALIDDAETAR